MKGKILTVTDVYFLSNSLFWWGQNDNYHIRFGAQLHGGKRKTAASLIYLYKQISWSRRK